MTKPNRTLLAILFAISSLAAFAQQPEFGLASFYDDSFQGSLTAYNVKYNKSDLTTSHKTYPYGTKLRVTRLDNKKSVIVTVIDKGPYMKGRIVDLSRRAAQELGMIEAGTAEVKVELYQKASKTEAAPTTTIANNTTKPKSSTDVPESFDKDTRTTIDPPSRPVSTNPSTTKTTVKPTSTTKTAANTKKVASTVKDKTTEKGVAPARLVKQDYKEYGLYKIQLERPVKKGYGVQVASLASYESVMKQIADLQAKSFTNILVSAEKGTKNKPVYKVILGPQTTEAAATSYKASLKKRYKINGFVVNLEELTY
jgi:rare lipoprotein A